MNFVFLFVMKVGSNAGIIGMTKEHLGLALALNVPVFVVVTKIDMCPANILQGNANLLFYSRSFINRICGIILISVDNILLIITFTALSNYNITKIPSYGLEEYIQI